MIKKQSNMLIGGDFNKKCEHLLVECGKQSGMVAEKKVSVETLNRNLGYDRTEMRSYLEYLADKEYIHLSTIGGPFLYGHISLTSKGIKKLKDFPKRGPE